LDVDAIVIGAGVVGLAVARRLAEMGREVLILEAEDAIGTQTSSRNSEVIHAGIYYPRDSLKARLCVAGRRMLYDYCTRRGVPAQRIGKLIVATTPAQVATIDTLLRRGTCNGVDDLAWLDADAARSMEPALDCVAAIFSPSTGIVDSHALMLALLGDAEAHGAQCVLRTRVEAIVCKHGGFDVVVASEGAREATSITCAAVVNCAGLGAQAVAAHTKGYPRERVPPLFLAKGNYFSVTGATPFSHLIYPIPVEGGAGIHITLDLNGRMRLGPDLHWVQEIDYTPDESVTDQFYSLVQSYWP
jgi:L-2-hydroxyglutarate oxidase LhgO